MSRNIDNFDNLDDAHLETILRSIGAELHLQHTLQPIQAERIVHVTKARKRLRAYAITFISICALVFATPAVRAAVANWFGIGSTEIKISPNLTSLEPLSDCRSGNETSCTFPKIDQALAEINGSSAAASLGFALPDLSTTPLGKQVRFATMPEGGVLVIWADNSTLWLHSVSIEPAMLLKKLGGSGVTTSAVNNLGDAAIAISGPHWLQTPHRKILATNTILWVRGMNEFRLESNLPPDQLINVARELDDQFKLVEMP